MARLQFCKKERNPVRITFLLAQREGGSRFARRRLALPSARKRRLLCDGRPNPATASPGENPLPLRQGKKGHPKRCSYGREALALLEVPHACRLRASSTRSARWNRTLAPLVQGSH